MSQIVESITRFVDYAGTLDGDEKGEAQVFCDRLFQAFGHEGYKEAGATLEYRIKKGKSTSFADLIWKPRLLIEMKKAGEKLHLHYQKAFEYWINAVPNRPRYVVLCNFREFQIYDFDKQLNQPVDTVQLEEFPKRYTAFNFLFPNERKPQFNNDREAVSRRAADQMAELFRNLTHRVSTPIPRPQAQRFVLQTVVSMFAEDIDLLPAGTIKGIVDDCLDGGQSSYDLLGALFQQMDNPTPAKGGRFRGVRYFNGGLFSTIQPIELGRYDLELLGGESDGGGAATKDWSKVNPAIFGTLFQHSMEADARHALGAHFTSEADIQHIVSPTDLRLMSRLQDILSVSEFQRRAPTPMIINPKQFFGLDIDPFGVELAKVTLMLAKKLALDEAANALGITQEQMALGGSDALPLDNLDQNIRCEDATSKPSRYVIDFLGKDVAEATDFPEVFKRIKSQVLPTREKAAAKEEARNKAALAGNPEAKVNHHHANCLKYWWRMSYDREDMIDALHELKRYITCGRVTKRPIFDFVSTTIHANDACMVFAHDDDYSYGILQSGIHWLWFTNRCSTLKSDFRYTSNTVFDSFPWPQQPSAKEITAVADAAVAFRKKRNELRAKHNLSLRNLYRALDLPGSHPLKDAQAVLDEAVRKAYGMNRTEDPLAFLLALNELVAAAEKNGDPVQGAGLPAFINDRDAYVTDDCIEP